MLDARATRQHWARACFGQGGALPSPVKMLKALGELGLVALTVFGGCSRPDGRDMLTVSSAALSASAAPSSASASVAPGGGSAAAAPPASVVVPAVDAGPPRQIVQGDGITITETGNGEVILKTTSLWNDTVDTTYASCDYFRGAVPVLKRQLREDRAKLLGTICVAKK